MTTAEKIDTTVELLRQARSSLRTAREFASTEPATARQWARAAGTYALAVHAHAASSAEQRTEANRIIGAVREHEG